MEWLPDRPWQITKVTADAAPYSPRTVCHHALILHSGHNGDEIQVDCHDSINYEGDLRLKVSLH